MSRRATFRRPRRPRACGAVMSAALFASALGMIAFLPAQSAQAFDLRYDMYDINVDGVIDASATDSSGNEVLDRNFVDLDGNKVGETWLIDRNEDRVADQIIMDLVRGDGWGDVWFLDNDQNHAVEQVLVDADGDTQPDAPGGFSFTIVPPPMPTFDIGLETNVCPTDPFWCGRWPRTVPSAGTNALPPGVSIAAGLNALDGAAANNSLL